MLKELYFHYLENSLFLITLLPANYIGYHPFINKELFNMSYSQVLRSWSCEGEQIRFSVLSSSLESRQTVQQAPQ